MGKLLPGVARVNWTMKRYLYALCCKLNVRVKAGATAVVMGKLLDKRLTGDKETVTKVSDKKTRWAARLDSARLLMIMFGTSEMRQQFVLATQPLTMAQLDNRIDKTDADKYWCEVVKQFSDPKVLAPIVVKHKGVQSYCREELSTLYRRPAGRGVLQQQWCNMRKAYEASDELAWWRASGQGNPNFYPNFCRNNAVHVLLFYIFRDAKDNGEADLELCAMSLIEPSEQVCKILRLIKNIKNFAL